MKFKNLRKFIAPTVMTALLVSVPVLSNAVSTYKYNYNRQHINYLNQTITRPSNNYYIIANDKSQTTGNYNNYYGVSRGNYSRPIPNTNTSSNIDNISNRTHYLTAAETQMIDYVNKARQDAGLQPLEIDIDLAYVARVKSEDMYNNKYFSHDSPTYGSPFNMMDEFGIKYNGAAENIAKNNSVEAAHNALMRSQGHKDNILNPIYTHIGVGVYNGYYTQMFIRK